jgi:hypothetical protein
MINTIVLTTFKNKVMKSIKTTNPFEVLRDTTVKLLRDYYDKSEEVECTDGFFCEFLYFMNGGNEGHTTNAIYYARYCERAMKAFADPRVASLLAESMGDNYLDFVEMIFRLLSLMNKLNSYDHYEALIESYQIELYGYQEDEKHIQHEKGRIELKLAALRVRHPDVKL